jgi:hypothetical protein
MVDGERARLVWAGVSSDAKPTLGHIDIDGEAVEAVAAEYVDPAVRSGRGGNPGSITSLSTIADVEGNAWLLATVERGRPRLIDPHGLGVVALLGRRREWRGSALERGLFLPIVCDRAPVEAGAGRFLLPRTLAGELDLLRVCPGAELERWCLGAGFARRVELLGVANELALVSGDELAILDLDELVPGGTPLTDPRDVQLSLRWSTLPPTVVTICDLHPGPLVRAIEREDDRWSIAEYELSEARPRRRERWPIDRPDRWRSAGAQLWLAAGEVWTRVELGRGPVERAAVRGGDPAIVELDAEGHPWLWSWLAERAELQRFDALDLGRGPIQRWALPWKLHLHRLLVAPRAARAPDPALVRPADEFAELLALEPELAEVWASWFA